ncbi:hypothetical protein BDV95DRAFT_119920 [Massariosphaeria phaeospora]|uniref:Nuclear pore complex protein Nup85 n=1 Tax=Massariosphaeria phaeospora TaxID=100035 RepID=A0A7C8M580_9PLEO|nr:hypothetical protein BDV95DRAFT_119920 [Massariosphaeria phaeospora]
MFRPSSTPDSRRPSRPAPSTTPAGPPPDASDFLSSTPAGSPPASHPGGLFGSGRPHFGAPASHAAPYNNSPPKPSLFAGLGSVAPYSNFAPKTGPFNGLASGPYGSSPPKNGLFEGVGSDTMRTSTSGRPATQRGRSGFRVPSSSPPESGDESDEDEEDEDMEDGDGDEDDEEEDAEGDEDDEMMEDEQQDEDIPAVRRPGSRTMLSQSLASQNSGAETLTGLPIVLPDAKQSQYDLLGLAKGLTPTPDRATLRESDQTILDTERILEKLHEQWIANSREKRMQNLGDAAQELVALWQTSSQSWSQASLTSSRAGGANPAAQAYQLASLLLNMHHPGRLLSRQRTSFALVSAPARQEARNFTPIPKVLLAWLNNHHSAASEVDLVFQEPRAFSEHHRFWEAVQSSAFRGKLANTLKLLKGANFEFAETAQADGLGHDGYSGLPLENARKAVKIAIAALEECPAVMSDDWDVKSNDWSIFRQRIIGAMSDLEDFAEGESQNRQAVPQNFQASHFGISQSHTSFQLSVASRRAESRVPWTVYQNLSGLYRLLLGREEDIITMSADWIEATLGLTIWWNGDETGPTQGSLAASRRSLARSQKIRTVDITPVKAYCQRLASAFATILEGCDEGFSINTNDRFEVGLACIFDNNIEGAIQILCGWSLTIASAVAEIGSAGEWFTRADGLLNQFDPSDLMLLSYTEKERTTGISKDDLLVSYSDQLTQKAQVAHRNGRITREGWELAIQVLGRLDDTIKAAGRVEHILEDLPLRSPGRVDKITQLCHNMGLTQHALSIALKYADHLRANTQNYGDTLMYYARAHAAGKIQEVLRVLVAHCLVKSIAYPPPEELDDSLNALITSPKQTLTRLAAQDSEAAQLLSNYLSGYATIRKFYDLRDQEILVKDGEKPTHRPMARKRAAANALMVIIASAGSSIQGGLYDPDVETVVQVDVLLPLLGEALVFVNQPKRTLTLQHLYALLAAVEDLETAPSMIKTQCEECLATAIAAAHDGATPSPHHLLQKSTSNLTTASSQYSLIGSVDFSSVEGQSTESSAVLIRGGHVDASKRGWDWRRGLGKDASGADVVRMLRLGLAKEIARVYVEGEVVV